MSSLSSSTVSARPGTPSTPISVRGVERRPGRRPTAVPWPGAPPRLGVAGHDRDDAAGGGAPAQLVDQRLRMLEVPEHAMAQHGVEASTVHRLLGVLAVGLQERHPSPGLSRQPLESLSRLVQHRRRRVQHRHLVAGLGQRERLMARAAADIEHRRRRPAAGAPAAGGASRRCARSPSPRRTPRRRTGRPEAGPGVVIVHTTTVSVSS